MPRCGWLAPRRHAASHEPDDAQSPHSLTKDDAALTLAQLKESNKTKKTAKELAAAATAAAQKAADDAAALAERQATEALDLYTCAIPALGGKSITVGQIRHRACEPLMLGRADGGRTVQEALYAAVQAVEPAVRQAVCDGLVFVGEMAEIQCASWVCYKATLPRLTLLPRSPAPCDRLLPDAVFVGRRRERVRRPAEPGQNAARAVSGIMISCSIHS